MMARRSFIRGIVAVLAAPMPRRALADDLDSGAFRKEVVKILHKYWPDIVPQLPDDPTIITIGSIRSYLGNLWGDAAGRTGTDREEIIKSFLQVSIDTGRKGAGRQKTPDWPEAEGLLTLQIAPVEYRTELPALLSRDLAKRVIIAYALDSVSSYTLVNRDMMTEWKTDQDAIHAAAMAGLRQISVDVEIKAKTDSGGSGRYVTVISDSSYNAALLLAPDFITRLHSALGDKIFIGIPCRDTLIAWTPDFQRRSRLYAKIREDAETQPHPLTGELFAADAGGIRLATADEIASHMK